VRSFGKFFGKLFPAIFWRFSVGNFLVTLFPRFFVDPMKNFREFSGKIIFRDFYEKILGYFWEIFSRDFYGKFCTIFGHYFSAIFMEFFIHFFGKFF